MAKNGCDAVLRIGSSVVPCSSSFHVSFFFDYHHGGRNIVMVLSEDGVPPLASPSMFAF